MTEHQTQFRYNKAAEHFIQRNPNSKAIYERATQSLPGGNTRSALFYAPFPVSIRTARGARLYDVDGHEYVDFLGEYTAGLYGHSEPIIIKAIQDAASRGLNFGSHNPEEAKLAALVKARFPSMDLLRFTNSGTEATLMALAVAKVYTRKSKIVVFDGAYHGGAFAFANGRASPVNAPHDYLIAKYNDLSSVHRLLEAPENENAVAVILVEPMMGSGGAIAGTKEFLLGLREAATKSAAVLIFDEVMTSRMYEGGGIQSRLSMESRPDMTTLGKYVGGGMSFGAFGGKRAIMQLFDPRREGALAHAGTFNNNVLTMSAGRVGLERVFTPQRARQLHERGDGLRKALQEASRGTRMKVTGVGSIMCFHFTNTKLDAIQSSEDLRDADKTLGSIFHLYLLSKGIYIARRGFMALSLPLADADINRLVVVVREFVQEHASLLAMEPGKARL